MKGAKDRGRWKGWGKKEGKKRREIELREREVQKETERGVVRAERRGRCRAEVGGPGGWLGGSVVTLCPRHNRARVQTRESRRRTKPRAVINRGDGGELGPANWRMSALGASGPRRGTAALNHAIDGHSLEEHASVPLSARENR